MGHPNLGLVRPFSLIYKGIMRWISLYFFLLLPLGILPGCQANPSFNDASLSNARQAFAQGNYQMAERLFLQTLDQAKQAGISDERVASIFYFLGELYRLKGENDQAEIYLWKALPIWAKTVGPTHPEMAKGLTSLSLIYEGKGEYEKALPLVKQALKVREGAYGSDHPNIIPTLDQYANLLKQMNRTEEAEALIAKRRNVQPQ